MSTAEAVSYGFETRRQASFVSTASSSNSSHRQESDTAKMNVRVLVLSLVHPDFLAPLYSVSRVLRDHGYLIDIFSFSSNAGGSISLPPQITLHDCGAHAGNVMQRLGARRHFRHSVSRFLRARSPVAIIASCPFSLLEAQRLARGVPLIYFAFELYDPALGSILRSPASRLRN